MATIAIRERNKGKTMQISENALVVLERRYLTQDAEGASSSRRKSSFGALLTLAAPDLLI